MHGFKIIVKLYGGQTGKIRFMHGFKISMTLPAGPAGKIRILQIESIRKRMVTKLANLPIFENASKSINRLIEWLSFQSGEIGRKPPASRA